MRVLRERLAAVAARHGEALLDVKNNPISCAMTLSRTAGLLAAQGRDVTFLGSMLFARRVSGTRVISTTATKEVAGIHFKGYGAHVDEYPTPYLTAAAAIGLTDHEIDVFVQKLDAVLTKIEKSAVDKRQDGAQGSVAGGGKSDVKG